MSSATGLPRRVAGPPSTSLLKGFASLLFVAGCGAPTQPKAPGAQARRAEVVSMVRSGELAQRDEFGEVVLPEDLADTSVTDTVTVTDDPFMVFFTTWRGWSPDPHCGYEYGPDPQHVAVDPVFSGTGQADALGDDWYWVCAS
jgi:hypothetical protein